MFARRHHRLRRRHRRPSAAKRLANRSPGRIAGFARDFFTFLPPHTGQVVFRAGMRYAQTMTRIAAIRSITAPAFALGNSYYLSAVGTG